MLTTTTGHKYRRSTEEEAECTGVVVAVGVAFAGQDNLAEDQEQGQDILVEEAAGGNLEEHNRVGTAEDILVEEAAGGNLEQDNLAEDTLVALRLVAGLSVPQLRLLVE